MMKHNKGKLILSSLLILLPIPLGLLLAKIFPERFSLFLGLGGMSGGFSVGSFGGKTLIWFPLLLLGIHWFCLFFTSRDHKNANQSQKIFSLVFWIIPVISLFCWGVLWLVSSGKSLDVTTIVFLMFGLLFLIFGNYMPKCRQNHTIGLKLSWTLASEENWNATHRFAGKVWVIGGLVMACGIFVPEKFVLWILTIGTFLLVVLPILYSWLYYRKQAAAGLVPKKPIVPASREVSRAGKITLVVVLASLAVLLVFLFTAGFEIQWNETSFTLETAVWDDLTVEYDTITALEYREDDGGFRIWGFGGPQLSIGSFQGDTFGVHTRFTYASCDTCVVITAGENLLILNGKDEEATRAIYERLLEKTMITKEAAE